MSSPNNAWVTLATNDSYSLGALVLAHSLKTVGTVHKLAILITPGVTAPMKQQIEAVFDEVKVVDVLDSKDQTHLALMCRPELGVTFTKLHCWTFTNYDKCVFLDADTLVLQNCDELFEREELSAAPDPGWPDCFNSGVFVYKPSQDTFGQLLEFARTRGSFDGGDQGLLNMFFKEWSNTDISKHLSFTYNVVWSSTYSYLPALKQFGQNMKIVHFISSSKPWLQSFNTETRLVTSKHGGSGLQELLQLWWDLFCRHVHPRLSTEMGGLAGQFARVPLGEKTPDQKALEDFLRRQSWEQGNMDYLGRDSFSNIWSKINETLGNVPEVSIEAVAVTTPTPPEVVHTEEPRPLKSALKKTSTTIPPVSSELEVDSSDLAIKQLEKLDLSKDILKELKTPDTPTVTAPTPPTTPATQAQESVKPVSVESVKETIKSDDTIKESQQPAELESTKSESTELVQELPTSEACTLKSVEEELPKPELVEPVKETSDASTESKESSKLEENSSKSDSPAPKTDEPVKNVAQPSEIAQASQISVDNSTPLVSNDPPVAPKRTNKGSPSVSKNTKSSEKK
ncbi:glycogenin-1 isoform X2 [Acyrthosiphon pisum]|uniref:glycogenin glucosyltransferase n=1 Tax=Acyrthosiphon pisum TaxID=7029 RepID=A0A8R1W4H9_ACYPI|nr:glycogenin-1 isoform X2 [Acyrthosiphon pisum]|eukprot:XP_003242490.1 PREDICTED: glycogenin-1 isoform X2 [Acyrthosiphon pisum]